MFMYLGMKNRNSCNLLQYLFLLLYVYFLLCLFRYKLQTFGMQLTIKVQFDHLLFELFLCGLSVRGELQKADTD